MKHKYPMSLFVLGFMCKMFQHYRILLPSFVLLFAGIWIKWCSMIGTLLFLLAAITSLIGQLRDRSIVLNSDNPNFKDFQEAVLSPNWKDNLISMTEETINEHSKKTPSND